MNTGKGNYVRLIQVIPDAIHLQNIRGMRKMPLNAETRDSKLSHILSLFFSLSETMPVFARVSPAMTNIVTREHLGGKGVFGLRFHITGH